MKELAGIIRKEFTYNPETGVVSRTTEKRGISYGHLRKHRNTKYVIFDLKPYVRTMRAHRIAWFLTYGIWPEIIDHINGDGADNRLCNLRICTAAGNCQNRRPKAGRNLKGFTANTPRQGQNRYQAKIQCDKRLIYLGTYDTEIEAAQAYDIAARQYHGEFARLNFPNQINK